MKKIFLVIVMLILFAICLFPRKIYLTDGGSVVYKSLIYSIKDSHEMINEKESLEGWSIEIFGMVIYDGIHAEFTEK